MRRNDRFKDQPGQRGQAILWFLTTTAACCVTLALVYNMGQVTNEKEKTVNAADATALAGAIVEARMLNFDAYANRAIIADEVNVAQVLSLDSWVQYLKTLSQNLGNYFGWVPILGDILQTLSEAMQEVGTGVDDFAKAMIPVDDTVVQALVAAQAAVRYSAVPAARDIANNVASANQASVIGVVDATAFALNFKAWLDFSKVYSKNDNGNDDRNIVTDVIKISRDQFSTHRDEGFAIDAINLALGGPIAQVTGVAKTSGDTILPNYDRWEAQDSLDIWTGVQAFGITIYKTFLLPPSWVPLGYGRVDTDQNGTLGNDWDWWSGSGGGPCPWPGTPNCEYAYQSGTAVQGWSGMPEITDLTNQGSANNNPSLTYVAAVTKAAPMTTQRMGSGMNNIHVDGPQGSPDLTDNLHNDQLASVAAARVSFMRPDWNAQDRTQGQLPNQYKVHEYASLYNPYWQARLTDPNTVKIGPMNATTAIYAAINLPGLNCAMDPKSCLP
jgi:putative Flp pilus-assembly TadE/G-like protein